MKAEPIGPMHRLGQRLALAGTAVALGGILATATPAAAAAGIDVRGELECLALTIYFEARGSGMWS